MTLHALRQQLQHIENQIQALHDSGEVFPFARFWVSASTPGAKPGEVPHRKQFHIRSRQPVFNGKKSRYLKATEVGDIRAQIARRRSLDLLIKQREAVRKEIETIRKTAEHLGLIVPD